MGFLKAKKPQQASTEEKRLQERSLPQLLEQLNDPLANRRRRAALDLGKHEDAADALCNLLHSEEDPAVVEAIFTSLIRMGGQQAVEGMMPFLRSEDAALRNHAVEALQQLPDDVGPYMQLMLEDNDSDVRIFAINVLSNLHHPMAHVWLEDVVENDENINVCGTAVDVLAEIGTEEQIPLLEKLPERFDNNSFIQFAVDMAIERIRGDIS